MNHEAVAPVLSSRPKIHRLPATVLRSPEKPRLRSVLLKGGVMMAALTIVVVMLGWVVSLSSASRESFARVLAGSGGAPVSDAMASTLLSASPSDSTIVLADKSGTIVGRMAKIPAQNEHITEIKPVSEVDNRAGRELLSIINKY
jgi:hypothetical protein